MSTDISDIGAPPSLFARVRNILAAPQTEWRRVASEEPAPLLKSHVVPLAAAGAAAGLLAGLAAQDFAPGREWSWLLVSAVLHIALAVAGVVLVGWLADLLAPRFGAERDGARARQLAAYASTAALVAGLAVIAPLIGPLVLLGGLAYSGVLLGLGAQALLRVPEERVAPFALSVIGAATLVALVAALLVTPWLDRGRDALASVTPSLPAPASAPAPQPEARRSEVERALLRLAQSNGRGAPIDSARLEEQLPQSLPGGFALTSTSRGSVEGMPHAEGEYRSGDGRFVLRILHLGAITDPAAAARVLDVEPASDGGYVRRNGVDGRLFVERVEGEAVEYVVIGLGVALRVEGSSGVTVDRARAAVETIGVQRLERAFGAN